MPGLAGTLVGRGSAIPVFFQKLNMHKVHPFIWYTSLHPFLLMMFTNKELHVSCDSQVLKKVKDNFSIHIFFKYIISSEALTGW